MTRGDFWCRVLGWLQVAGGVAVAACVYALWSFFFGWIELRNDAFLDAVLWIILFLIAFPALLAGVLTIIFADFVEQARNGKRDEAHVVFRVILAVSGLWSAGFIGVLGFSMPSLGFFAVLGLVTSAVAIMGQDWTADLFTQSGVSA